MRQSFHQRFAEVAGVPAMRQTTPFFFTHLQRIVFTAATVLALSQTSAIAVDASAATAGTLTLQEEPGVFTIQFSGREGHVGIPSWKIVLRRDHAGNIADLRVPQDSPASLSYGADSIWPIAVLATASKDDLPATMSDGRENFATFRVETFDVAEKSPEKIVVRVGGPSKNKHFEHYRTYTFTPVGVQIEGEVMPLVDLRSIALKTRWDRRQIADSHLAAMPMRSQGGRGWVYMPSSGSDAAVPLPANRKFPLEAELRLRRPEPTFMKLFFDRNFEVAEGKQVFVHNDKDVMLGDYGMAYMSLTSLVGDAVAKGQKQTFKVRFEFETRQWP